MMNIEERLQNLEETVASLTRIEELRDDLASQVNNKVEERLKIYKENHTNI